MGRRERPADREPGREGDRHHQCRSGLVPRLRGRRSVAGAAFSSRRSWSVAGAVRVPVTVDVEGGYSSDPADVGETVGAVIDGGRGRDQHRGRRGLAGPALRQDREHPRGPHRRGGRPVRERPNGRLPARSRARGRPRRRDAGARRALSGGGRGRHLRAGHCRSRRDPRRREGFAAARQRHGLARAAARGRTGEAGRSPPERGCRDRFGAVVAKTASLAAAFLRTGAFDGAVDEPLPYGEINALMTARG